jgi:ankyrin repeat protein
VTPPEERDQQDVSDHLVSVIQEGIMLAGENAKLVPEILSTVRDLLARADPNRLGGPLRQPPLVVAVTGNNGDPPSAAVAELRFNIAQLLLENGADPTAREHHPMGVHAIIRAAVFNHIDILELMGHYMKAEALRDALNEVPIVNGLTALHDSVLRASMTSDEKLGGYLDQIRWCVANGARYDIEDFSGRTQQSIAENTADPGRRRKLTDALGVTMPRM